MSNRFRSGVYMLNLSFEGVLFFMAAMLLSGGNTWGDALSFALSYLAAAALPLLLFLRSDKPEGWKLFLFIPLSFLLFYFAAGLPPLLAALLSVALIWRAFVNWLEGKNSDAEKILIVSFLFLLILAFFYNENKLSFLLIAGGVQAFLLLLLKMAYRWDGMERSIALREASFTGIFMLVVICAGSLLSGLKTVVSSLLMSVVFAIYYMVILPLFTLLSAIPFVGKILSMVNDDPAKLGKEQSQDETLKQLAGDTSLPDLAWLGWPLAGILLSSALFFLYKKKFNFQQAGSATVSASYFNQASPRFSHYKRKWLQSENVVRKQMAALEKDLHKKGFERLPGETAGTWFHRLNLQSEEAEQVLLLYEKVRYAEAVENAEERKQFKSAIKNIRQELKRH